MQSHTTRVLTSRTSSAVALCLTGFMFALVVREILHPTARAGWLFGAGVFHGWPRGTLAVLFYGYLGWFAFWCIRKTSGAERTFLIGWFPGLMLAPLRALRASWSVTISHIAAVGLAVAMLAALALLLKPDKSDNEATLDD